MSVYVDRSENPFYGMLMCHMMADTLRELHEMADRIGMRREWYQPKSTPHYDLCETRRKIAILHGAIEIDRQRTVEIIREWRKRSERELLLQRVAFSRE